MSAKVTNCKVVISYQLKVCLNSQPSRKASEASASGGLFRHRRQYPGSQPCAKEAEIDIIACDETMFSYIAQYDLVFTWSTSINYMPDIDNTVTVLKE